MIGTNLFHLGLVDEARKVTQTAVDACYAVGDAEGVAVYQENLQFLKMAEGSQKGVDEGVARAQLLSDQGRYKESIAILETLLQGATGNLNCKINGLLGANYHWRGDREVAVRYLETAVALAEASNDIEAQRIYRNNLEIVRKNNSPPRTLADGPGDLDGSASSSNQLTSCIRR